MIAMLAPVAEVFGPRRSSDGGWSFDHGRKAGLYLGQLRTVPTPEALRDGAVRAPGGLRLLATERGLVGYRS